MVQSGNVYGQDNVLKGWVQVEDSGNVYDEGNKLIGSVEDSGSTDDSGNVYDQDNVVKGWVGSTGKVCNQAGKLKGSVEDSGNVYDEKDKFKGSLTGISGKKFKGVAALLFLLTD